MYLDNAATSRYVPPACMRAFVDAVQSKANAGRSAHRDSAALALAIYRVRRQIKQLVDNPEAEVVFTKNCTEALNLGIRWVQYGHIVSTITEHNSVLRPLAELQQLGRVTYTLVAPDGPNVGVSAANIEAALQSNTRLIVVNHVSNVTGIANDVAGIGRLATARGIPFLVDAAQSLGHMPISMRAIGCDMLAAPAHKGLHGLQGLGFLVFNHSVRPLPLLYGGTGTDSMLITQPNTLEGLEAGTLNGAAICALGAAIKWTQGHWQAIQKFSHAFGTRLYRGLGQIPRLRLYGGDNGILSLAVQGLSSAQVADKLDEMGLATRAGLHCAPMMHKFLGTVKQGLVRLSWGWNNHLYEVERIVACLQSIVNGA